MAATSPTTWDRTSAYSDTNTTNAIEFRHTVMPGQHSPIQTSAPRPWTQAHSRPEVSAFRTYGFRTSMPVAPVVDDSANVIVPVESA